MLADSLRSATGNPAPGAAPGRLPPVLRSASEIRDLLQAARGENRRVGLVPTMGALHEGHLSLVKAARSECDLVVVTIFVNPTQFAPHEDFARYPRDLERDVALVAECGCDAVFAPPAEEVYRPDHSTFVDVGELGQVLEGEIRPTHFRGVATVVLKLFHLVPAQRAYFGRKDYQQALVIERMVRDLNVPIELCVCPIVREADGLALSSRNAYLTPDQRRRAAALYRALAQARGAVDAGVRDVAALREQMEEQLRAAGGIEVQYIAFVADGTVRPVTTIDGPTTVALAAVVGTTRLIDNILVGEGGEGG